MSILENIQLRLSVDRRQVETQFNSAARTVNRGLNAMTLGAEAFEAQWEDITSQMRSVKRIASGMAISQAIYAVTGAITGATAAVLQFSDNMDQAYISMQYFTRNANEAKQAIRELQEFAAYTPFSTEGAINMTKYLQAMSVPASMAKSVLKVISDTAAATGATEENMQRIVTALGQILTKGRLAAEEVRQLSNANIPAVEILKEELNMTGEQIKNIGNYWISGEKAVVAILDGLEKRYDGASAKIAETMGGMVDTIKDDALIISSSFFAGAVDTVADKVEKVRDVLDEWRTIIAKEGTGGLITTVVNDIDPSGSLEQYIMAGIAGIKNLGETIRDFAFRSSDLLKIVGTTGYTTIMTLTIAADYLIRGLSTINDVANKALGVVNNLTGMNMELSDMIASFIAFKKISSIMSFAANTTMWFGQCITNVGAAIVNIIPGLAAANGLVKGLAVGFASVGATALLTYGSLKMMQKITGLQSNSKLVSDDYLKQFDVYNETLSAYSDGLNESYKALSDGASKAFNDVEEKSKKSAKKVQKTWLMSFDEVFQIREDPDDEDTTAEDIASINWGQFFTLPLFRFPERVGENIEEPIYSLSDAINSAKASVDGIAALLPALIGGLTLTVTSAVNKSRAIRSLEAQGKYNEEDYTQRELLRKFRGDLGDYLKADDELLKLVDQYKALDNIDIYAKRLKDIRETLSTKLDEAIAVYKKNPTDTNKAIVEGLENQIKRTESIESLLEAQAKKRTILAEQIEYKQKELIKKVEKLKETRARAGNLDEISTKGITAADNVLSIKKLNEAIGDLRQLSASTVDTNSKILSRLRTAAREGTSTDTVEITHLRAQLTDQLNALDKGMLNAQKEISQHIQKFGSSAGLDINALDDVLRDRVGQMVDDQTRSIATIARSNGDLTLDVISDIERHVKQTSGAIDRLAELSKSSPELLSELNKIKSNNEVIANWLDTSGKLRRIDSSLVANDLLKGKGTVTHSYIDATEEHLSYRRQKALNDRAAAQQAVEALDKISTEYSDAVKVLKDSRDILKVQQGYLSTANKLIDRSASVATEIKKYMQSGSYDVASKTYSVLYDTLDELINSASLEKLQKGSAFKPLIQNFLGDTKKAFENLDITKLQTTIDSFDSKIKSIVDAYNTSYQTKTSAAITTFSGHAAEELTAEQLEAHIEQLTKIKEATTEISHKVINTDNYAELLRQTKKIDDVIDEVRIWGAANKVNNDAVESLIAAMKRPAEEMQHAVNEVLTNPQYIDTFSDLKNGNALKTIFKDSEFKTHVDTVEQIRSNFVEGKRLAKASRDAAKAIKTANDEITDAFELYNTRVNAATEEFAAAVRNSPYLDNVIQAKFINKAADDIQRILEVGVDSFGEAVADLSESSAKNISMALGQSIVDRGEFTLDAISSLNKGVDTAKTLIDKYHDTVADALDKADASIENSLNKIGKKKLPKADDAITAMQNKYDELFGDMYTNTTVSAKKLTPWESLQEMYRPNGVPGSIGKATGAYTAADFTNAKLPISNRWDDFIDILSRGTATSAPGKEAYRIGFPINGITRQGNTFYAALDSLIHGGIDEIAETRQATVNKAYASVLNVRTRDVLQDVLGTIYQGNTLLNSDASLAATVDGIFNVGEDTYELINRTVVSDKQKSLLDLVESIRQDAFKQNKVITSGSGRELAKVSFSDFKKAFEGIAEDVVNRVGAGLAVGTNTKGAYVNFTNGAGVLDAIPDLKKVTERLTSEIAKSPQSIAKYIKDNAARVLLNDANGSRKIANSTFKEYMQGFIVTAEGIDDFKAALKTNSTALESALHIYRTANVAGITGDGVDRLLKAYNGIEKMLEQSPSRYVNLSYDAANLPRVVATSIDEVVDGFNEYLKDLVTNATSRQNKALVRKTLEDLLDDTKKALTDSSWMQADDVSSMFGSRTFSYAFNSTSALTDAQKAINEALKVIDNSVSTHTYVFNDIISNLERGVYDSAEVANKLQAAAVSARYLEDTYGLLRHDISSQLIAMKDAGKYTGLANNPFRILGAEEAVGKMTADFLGITKKSMQDLTDGVSNEVKAYIEKSYHTYTETTQALAARIKTREVPSPTNITLSVDADAVAEGVKKAGVATASEARDIRLIGGDVNDFIPREPRTTLTPSFAPLPGEYTPWQRVATAVQVDDIVEVKLVEALPLTEATADIQHVLGEATNDVTTAMYDSTLKGSTFTARAIDNSITDLAKEIGTVINAEFDDLVNRIPKVTEPLRKLMWDESLTKALVSDAKTVLSDAADTVGAAFKAKFKTTDLNKPVPSKPATETVVNSSEIQPVREQRPWYIVDETPERTLTELYLADDETFAEYMKNADDIAKKELDSFRALADDMVKDGLKIEDTDALLDAVRRGDVASKNIERILQEQAMEIWGDQYKTIVNAAGVAEQQLKTTQSLSGAIAKVSDTKFGTALIKNIPGTLVSGLDIADSIRQGFDTASGGIDLAEQLNAVAKELLDVDYYKETLSTKSDIASAMGKNLLIEGAGIGGLSAGLGALGIVGWPAALITALGAAGIVGVKQLTGGNDAVNANAKGINNLLDSDEFYKAALAQFGDEKIAKEKEAEWKSYIYTNLVDKQKEFWTHGFFGGDYSKSDNYALVSKNRNKANNGDYAYDPIAVAYAVAELTNDVKTLAKYEKVKNEYSGLWSLVDKETGKTVSQDVLDPDILYAQMMAMYNTGIPTRTVHNSLAEQYAKLTRNIDAITQERLDKMFWLEKEAADYINSKDQAEITALLKSYGYASDNMAEQIQGIIQVYMDKVNYVSDVMQAKADAINAGSVKQITAKALIDGVGTASRFMEMDLSEISQPYLDALANATGIYATAISDTFSQLTVDLEEVRKNMTGFTIQLPSSIEGKFSDVDIQHLSGDVAAMEILEGAGVRINTDGTITVANTASNVNMSGHERDLDLDLRNTTGAERTALSTAGITLGDYNMDGKADLQIDEAQLLKAIKSINFTLYGMDATTINRDTLKYLSDNGLDVTQDEDTKKLSVAISDMGFITGQKSMADILAGLDLSRMSETLIGSLKSIDGLVSYAHERGQSTLSAASGVVVKTDLGTEGYSEALAAAFAEAGGAFQVATEQNGEEVVESVYAAINKIGEDWSGAITSWETSRITPELKEFLTTIGATIKETGEATIVDTTDVLKHLSEMNGVQLKEILFDNQELWTSLPEDVQKAFIAAGLATEDGFIVLQGEMLSGWTKIKDTYGLSFDAMDKDTLDAFIKLQGTTAYAWDELTEGQKLKLREYGVTSQEEYRVALNIMDQETKSGLGLVHEDTVLGWNEISDATKKKLADYGITTSAEYAAWLAKMDVETGQGLSTVDKTTAASLLTIGATTSNGWGGIKRVTDDELSETEALALGYMRFEDLPKTIQDALAEGKEGSAYEALHDGWYFMTTDTSTQLDNFGSVVETKFGDTVEYAKQKAQELRDYLQSPEFKIQQAQADLQSKASYAAKAAKSGDAEMARGGQSFYTDAGGVSHKSLDNKQWADWKDSIYQTSSTILIGTDGNPYLLYTYYNDGQPYGQVLISQATGKLKKYYAAAGVLPFDEDSEPPAFKMGGLISGDGLYRAGEFGLNEAVLPLEQPSAMSKVGAAIASAIPSWELVAPLRNMLGVRDGGAAPFSSYQREVTVQPVEEIVSKVLQAQAHIAPRDTYTEDKRPLIVGTLIADKSGLRELNRKMKIVERQDGGR